MKVKNQGKNSEPTWRFIVNPAAGGGTVRKCWPAIETQLRDAGINFEAVFTERKYHAAALAEQAVAEGYRLLVAVGGDGTAHEVVNGIMRQTTCPPEEVTFTLLPVGTGNDWVKTHRIPKNSRKWLAFFQNGTTTLQDVGWLNYRENGQEMKRYFINVAGLSYDAYVAKRAEAYKTLISSTIFYLFLIFRCLFEYRVPRIRVVFDGKTVEKPLYTINIGICRYSGGGLQLVPQAIPDDGKLALTLAGHISKLGVLLITPFFYAGKIGWHPKVSMFQAEAILVESADSQPVLVEADGEFLGEGPVWFGILPRALKLLVPHS
ncbi:MAG: diacylglycerol kinase family lipid kinase [Saprospiraceae bacterium]|nr:diacylglycerol kinase family lipid kinase [Saprospiraceae bacterium]MCF8250054.1 diacylglycerol kinase family lipid kinase [Saprospiraceae bacterium]MCF8279516.1 diacylglycerol kinase family lipid kinase [Bacteroidales bacterium]MCF8311980.1 diacylglycerol kinase family lipid kinase [Saprospiraceae bacterium]MCF8440330.1 diacylglycerol kinase family lipid kinase [Saprospiraceae bacterium]